MLRLGTLLGSLTPTLLMAGCVTAGWAAGAIAAEPTLRPALSPGNPPANTLVNPQRAEALALKSSPQSPTALAQHPTFWSIQRLSGFSADGRHYIHLESSRDTGAGIPKSVLQLVDVERNACNADLCLETRYGEHQSDWSIAQAELDLLRQTWPLRQTLQLANPTAGQTLTVVARSQEPQGTETWTLQTASLPHPITLRLRQQHRTVAYPDGHEIPQTAMDLELEYQGQRQVMGSLEQPQAWVLHYALREVKLSPQGDRLVVLLNVTKPTFEGTLATTLVQGFGLAP
jgi:predicted secreted protein